MNLVFRILNKLGTGFIEPATADKQLADNHQVRVSNPPDDYALPEAQLATITPQKDALTNAQLRAQAIDVADAGEREYTHVTAEVTDSGDTTVHAPASGKRIRLWWVYALNDPASDNPRLITIKLGTSEYYKTFGVSKRQKITGDIDAALVVNLSGAGSVAVTAIFEEIDG